VHFKVVLQAIGIMLSDMVLTMVVSTPDDQYSDNGNGDGDDGSSGGTTNNLDEHKGRLLSSLVEALRRNRTHWNVAVREASEVGLDRLLDIIM
jgi:hypothetical protein